MLIRQSTLALYRNESKKNKEVCQWQLGYINFCEKCPSSVGIDSGLYSSQTVHVSQLTVPMKGKFTKTPDPHERWSLFIIKPKA